MKLCCLSCGVKLGFWKRTWYSCYQCGFPIELNKAITNNILNQSDWANKKEENRERIFSVLHNIPITVTMDCEK